MPPASVPTAFCPRYDRQVVNGSLGEITLWASVATALLAVTASIADSQRWHRGELLVLGLITTSAALAVVATAALGFALLSGDFSIAYVADTTTRATQWPYRLSALWGAMEGSLLFWSAIMATVAVYALWSLRVRAPALLRPAMVTVAAVVAVFLLIDVLLANPFARLDIPAIDGGGLAAILRHPAMVYHAPFLYLGLTSLVVPFSFTVAALVTDRLDEAWLAVTRRWLGLSWVALTLGILAGANWAYVELGWGGFWAWDPVENTSLMPWLVVTAFLHSARVQQRSGRLARWNAGLAMLPFVLVMAGAYLTRSGTTMSVHTFAESRMIGGVLLAFATATALTAVVLLARRPQPKREWTPRSLVSREAWVLLNGAILLWAVLVVGVGTIAPPFLKVIFGEAVTVSGRYFTAMIAPIAAVALVLIGIGSNTQWETGSRISRRLLLVFGIAVPRPEPSALRGLEVVRHPIAHKRLVSRGCDKPESRVGIIFVRRAASLSL